MKIPKKFYLYGYPITVVFDKSLIKDGNAGLSCTSINKIKLNPNLKNNRALLEHTFLHELLHFIFLHIQPGRNKVRLLNGKELWLEETLIDSVSALLHQFITQREGELK